MSIHPFSPYSRCFSMNGIGQPPLPGITANGVSSPTLPGPRPCPELPPRPGLYCPSFQSQPSQQANVLKTKTVSQIEVKGFRTSSGSRQRPRRTAAGKGKGESPRQKSRKASSSFLPWAERKVRAVQGLLHTSPVTTHSFSHTVPSMRGHAHLAPRDPPEHILLAGASYSGHRAPSLAQKMLGFEPTPC